MGFTFINQIPEAIFMPSYQISWDAGANNDKSFYPSSFPALLALEDQVRKGGEVSVNAACPPETTLVHNH